MTTTIIKFILKNENDEVIFQQNYDCSTIEEAHKKQEELKAEAKNYIPEFIFSKTDEFYIYETAKNGNENKLYRKFLITNIEENKEK